MTEIHRCDRVGCKMEFEGTDWEAIDKGWYGINLKAKDKIICLEYCPECAEDVMCAVHVGKDDKRWREN